METATADLRIILGIHVCTIGKSAFESAQGEDMAPQYGLENELHGDVPGAYSPSNVSTGSDGSQSSVADVHQVDQFSGVTTELPQTIELDEDDEDDAGADVAGGLDFILALRNQSPAEYERNPQRADHGRPEGSAMVEPSRGSMIVSSETQAGTSGGGDREDVPRNGKPIASPNSCESKPANQDVAASLQSQNPDSSNTVISRIIRSLNDVLLGICFIIVIPTVVGTAVGFGAKSLIPGIAVGCVTLVIFTAVFAYLQVMWKGARARTEEERRQRGDGPSNGP